MSLSKFSNRELSQVQMKSVKGGMANPCKDLDNCYASRDGACRYSSDYGQCMLNQAAACDATFLLACMTSM